MELETLKSICINRPNHFPRLSALETAETPPLGFLSFLTCPSSPNPAVYINSFKSSFQHQLKLSCTIKPLTFCFPQEKKEKKNLPTFLSQGLLILVSTFDHISKYLILVCSVHKEFFLILVY